MSPGALGSSFRVQQVSNPFLSNGIFVGKPWYPLAIKSFSLNVFAITLPHIKIRNQGNIFLVLAKTEPFNFLNLL